MTPADGVASRQTTQFTLYSPALSRTTKPPQLAMPRIRCENAVYLWLYAQPDDFRTEKRQLTSDEKGDLLKYAEQAYFGPHQRQALQYTLDSNLYGSDEWGPNRVKFDIKPPITTLGTLDRLPFELIEEIISNLTISALFKFKAVNRKAFKVVEAHPKYGLINIQVPEALRGLGAVRLSNTFILQDLFHVLCEPKCKKCGEFGEFLYLLTLERVCGACFADERYAPLRELEVLREFGLSPEHLSSLPGFACYPGFYDRTESQGDFILIDREAAYNAGLAQHGSLEAMKRYAASIDPKELKSYNKQIRKREKQRAREGALYESNKLTRRKAYFVKKETWKRETTARREQRAESLGYQYRFDPPHRKGNAEDVKNLDEETDNETISTFASNAFVDESVDEGPFDKLSGRSNPRKRKGLRQSTDSDSNSPSADPDNQLPNYDQDWDRIQHRCMGVIRVPWLNQRGQRAESGFHCAGCEFLSKEKADKYYTWSTFKKHLEDDGPIKDGVHHINDCCNKGTCNTQGELKQRLGI